MSENNILISNIQRFSLHDGPGIRTTVFLKGCSVQCPWCSNPENINPFIQYYKDLNFNRHQFGHYISAKKLVSEVLKDKIYYDRDGGITYSGGEALLQIDSLIPVLEFLKKSKIHQCLETSLFVPKKNLEKSIDFIDLYIIDIKILDEKNCKNILQGDISLFLSNLNYVYKYNQNIVFRIPLIPLYTILNENFNRILKLLDIYTPIKVELIIGHNMGVEKYKALNIEAFYIGEIENGILEKFKQSISNMGIDVEMCSV